MLPNIWFIDSYSLMFLIGACMALFIFYLYAQKHKFERNYIYDILILATLTIIFGILSATAFQFLFNILKDKNNSSFAMTFFGGLVGGAAFFILGYKLVIKKIHPNYQFKNILIIAPACITIAHGFGRIGCFMAGCCYGKASDSFLAVKFPFLSYKVLPTQLFEATFLFIIFAILFILAYKYDFKYNMSIYLLSYGTFRFLIEFIRGDERGAFLFNLLSPSQVFSILAIIIGLILIIFPKVKKNMLK